LPQLPAICVQTICLGKLIGDVAVCYGEIEKPIALRAPFFEGLHITEIREIVARIPAGCAVRRLLGFYQHGIRASLDQVQKGRSSRQTRTDYQDVRLDVAN